MAVDWPCGCRARIRCSTEPSTARDAGGKKHPDLVRVTHRFHPLSGCSFEFVKRPFVVVSAGRSPFRTADLLVVAELAAQLSAGLGADDQGVQGILS